MTAALAMPPDWSWLPRAGVASVRLPLPPPSRGTAAYRIWLARAGQAIRRVDRAPRVPGAVRLSVSLVPAGADRAVMLAAVADALTRFGVIEHAAAVVGVDAAASAPVAGLDVVVRQASCEAA